MGTNLLAEMKNTKLKKTDGPSGNEHEDNGGRGDLLAQIRQGVKLNKVSKSEKRKQNNGHDALKEQNSSGSDGSPAQKDETLEERAARIDREAEERKKQRNNSTDLAEALAKRANAMGRNSDTSDSELSDSDSESGWDTDEEKKKTKILRKRESTSISSHNQSDKKEGTSTPESDYRSDDDVGQREPKITALPNHQPNTEKPPTPPKPADLHARSKASPTTKMAEVNDGTQGVSVKSRIAQFDCT